MVGRRSRRNSPSGELYKLVNFLYNLYHIKVISQEWAALNREVVEENGKLGDVMFWMRSGGVMSKFHQVMFNCNITTIVVIVMMSGDELGR